MVYFGYYNRFWSTLVYILFILLLFYFYFFFQKKKINVLKTAFLIGFLTLFSYPFLSHDFFNYLFDAKILTFYGKNPYQFSALDFPKDSWTRFMHWTHRTYPYGPTFLPITAIPSFFSVLAIYFLIRKKDKLLSAIFFILGGGIKYISLPLIFLIINKKLAKILSLFLIFILILYLTFFSEIQPWYFLIFFAFYPFFPKLVEGLNLFFAGLLFSYFPYLFLGGWDTVEKINQKHIIISIFTLVNVIYFIFLLFFYRWKSLNSS